MAIPGEVVGAGAGRCYDVASPRDFRLQIMLVKELIAMLQALPAEQKELELCSITDTWAIEVLPPRLSYLNENSLESVNAHGEVVPTARAVIVI